MKLFGTIILTSAALLMSYPVFSENRALNVTVVHDQQGLDAKALKAARKLIGTAVADAVIEQIMRSPLPPSKDLAKSIAFSSCIEFGTQAPANAYQMLIKQLEAIHPKAGTLITLEQLAACHSTAPSKELACGGVNDTFCPDNLLCIDNPKDDCDPLQGGQSCPGVCNGQ